MISIRAFAPFFGIALVALGCNGSIATVPSEGDSSLTGKDGKDKTTEQGPTDPVACPPVMITCKPGERLVDRNGDGCALECEPVSCPPVMPSCKPGEKAADLNGDGCALECVACPAILCAKGTHQVDTNGDGCEDACEPISCPPVMPNCKDGERAVDKDGDGCALECEACPLLPCAFGLTPFDSDGDGCPDTCK